VRFHVVRIALPDRFILRYPVDFPANSLFGNPAARVPADDSRALLTRSLESRRKWLYIVLVRFVCRARGSQDSEAEIPHFLRAGGF
jgi:hypothetical protein